MDHYLIEHCAPTLASIKTANLFRVSFDTQKNLFDAVRRWNNTLRDKGVLCFCLCLHEHTALIYVVRMSRLQMICLTRLSVSFFPPLAIQAKMQSTLSFVLRQHLMQSDTFPHEIGIFLGYPLADVKGFIINHGHNCLCCGDWKVYSDPENAVKTFRRYCKCKQIYRRMWEQGKRSSPVDSQRISA